MSQDPKSLLPWGIQQVKPGSLKTISDTKLATFAVGQQKKSRFQKAREEQEEKKRLEEAETAKIYESFVASFGSEVNSKTFVRGSSTAIDDSSQSRASDTYVMNSSTKTDPRSKPSDDLKVFFNFRLRKISSFVTIGKRNK